MPGWFQSPGAFADAHAHGVHDPDEDHEEEDQDGDDRDCVQAFLQIDHGAGILEHGLDIHPRALPRLPVEEPYLLCRLVRVLASRQHLPFGKQGLEERRILSHPRGVPGDIPEVGLVEGVLVGEGGGLGKR